MVIKLVYLRLALNEIKNVTNAGEVWFLEQIEGERHGGGLEGAAEAQEERRKWKIFLTV